MPTLSSSKLVMTALSTLLSLTFADTAFAAYDVPPTISVAEFSKDLKKVADLQRGIALMREASKEDPTSAKYRTSLAYWANTHGYFGDGEHATNLKSYIARRMPECLQEMTQQECDTYYAHMTNTPVPNDGFSNDVWGTCQHGNYNFLPWHRLYLHFFGRTLRKYIGDPNFTLPYWNYFENYVPSQKGLELPSIIRDSASSSLYDQWRTLGLNEKKVVMDPTSASAVQAFKFDDFPSFSDSLQGQPHGAMHCAVGSGCAAPDMGFVPIAGLDPIFYMHHTNIDRLWQCWMVRKANGKTIDLAWAKANLGMPDSWYDISYSFADENGNKATMTIADVFIPGKVDVDYKDLSNCDATPNINNKRMRSAETAHAQQERSPLKTNTPMVSAKSITLGSSTVNVSLQANKALTAAAPTKKEEGQVLQSYLTLKNVELKGAPALTYKIFLVNKKASAKSSYVATISFFGAGDRHHEGGANSLGTLVYQVSSNLAEIGVTSANDASIRFEPTNLLVGKNTVRQLPENGVTVENILLETSASPPSKN